MKKMNGAVKVLCAFIAAGAIFAAGYAAAGGSGASQDMYRPDLCIAGDVSNVMSVTPDENDYKMHSFSTDSGEYRGIRLADVLGEAAAFSEDSHVYLKGNDGMMASIALEHVEDTYLVFGERGWEAVSVNCPLSLDVKYLAGVFVVADNPSDVPSAVRVKDSNGTERTVSPGTMILKDSERRPLFQGESKKGERAVSVYTQDECTVIGDSELRLDDKNKIQIEKAGNTE